MGALEIILIVFCALIVVGVILSRLIRKKKGKAGCDCGCSDCSACNYCAEKKRNETNK